MGMTKTSYTTAGYMSCPRNCGVDAREHHSSDRVDGGCDTGNRARDAVHGEALLLNVHIDRLHGGYANLEGPSWEFLVERLAEWAKS